jgi:hypothetical protein
VLYGHASSQLGHAGFDVQLFWRTKHELYECKRHHNIQLISTYVSNALVASSSRIIGGFFNIVLAMATRCYSHKHIYLDL